MPVAAPADKRFRRAHVSPAPPQRRRLSWRLMAQAAVVVAVVVGGVYYTASLVLSADMLTVSRITVSGNSRVSRGEVLALLDDVRGAHMVTANLEAWRDKLRHSPWVADAALRRVFPGTLSVEITEREPMGVARVGEALYLVDRRGTIIDEYGPTYAELDLPIVDGLAAAAGGLLLDEGRSALAARLLADLDARPDLAERISLIDVADVRDAAIVLKDDTVVVHVGDERFVERIQSYIDLAPALRERVPDIDYVDLRFDERVYVKPVEGPRAKGQRPRAVSGPR